MQKHGAEMRPGSYLPVFDPFGPANRGYEVNIFGGDDRDSYDINP